MRYKITQDRWCFCGAPAALVVVERDGQKRAVEPVCTVSHGQMAVDRLRRLEKKEGEE